jgi:hypothetical protein
MWTDGELIYIAEVGKEVSYPPDDHGKNNLLKQKLKTAGVTQKILVVGAETHVHLSSLPTPIMIKSNEIRKSEEFEDD